MERLKNLKIKGEKIYRGAYSYQRNQNVYSEEQFEVYRDRHDLSLQFFADVHGRVVTGELLAINVDFKITKDFIPAYVKVEKTLGSQTVAEIFEYNKRLDIINYTFATDDKVHEEEISTNPIFSIATPASCTSMIFLKSKKEDPTSKNLYNVFHSYNQWEFDKTPSTNVIALQRQGMGGENIVMDGQTVQATQYKLFEDSNKKDSSPPSIAVYVSKYATIPYMIRGLDGTRIQIKYLNNLDKEA